MFCNIFPELSIRTSIGKHIKAELQTIQFTSPCPHFPLDYLINFFVRVRIYFTLKFGNKNFKTQLGKKTNKLIILQHL